MKLSDASVSKRTATFVLKPFEGDDRERRIKGASARAQRLRHNALVKGPRRVQRRPRSGLELGLYLVTASRPALALRQCLINILIAAIVVASG